MDSSMLPSFTLGSEPDQFRYPACSHYRADRLREGIHCNDFASSSAHAPVATINCEMGTSAISSSSAKQIVGMRPKEQTRFYAKDAGQNVIQKDNHCIVFASSNPFKHPYKQPSQGTEVIMANTTLSEQFSLRWNNFSSNLTSGFLNHLTENDLVDVTFAVEGQLLQAHKLVLSVCSPYFKNIFKENPCQHPVIILKDIKFTEIESLLKFMYQGEINIKKEDLSTFLKVAQTLQIRGLATDDANATKLFSNCDNQSNTDSGTQNVAQSYLSNVRDNSKDVKMMDRRKRSRDITKKSAKRKKQDASTLLESSYDLLNMKADNDDQEVLLLLNKDMNESRENVSVTEGNDNVKTGGNDNVKAEDNDNVKTEDNDNIKTEDNDNVKTEDFLEQASAETSSENPGQQADEPVIYRLSARGRPQLVYKGYVYNLTSRSEGLNRSHYRCAEQHRGCKGKCAVIAERFMPTDVRNHNHPPGYQSEHNYRKKKGFDVDTP